VWESGAGPQPQHTGNGAQRPTRSHETTASAPAPAPRASAPPPRQSVAYSAPPTREVPSATTGRPIGHRAPLTTAELEIARSSGISPEQYAENKARMEKMKQSGQIQ